MLFGCELNSLVRGNAVWDSKQEAKVHLFLFVFSCPSSSLDFPSIMAWTWNCKLNKSFPPLSCFWSEYLIPETKMKLGHYVSLSYFHLTLQDFHIYLNKVLSEGNKKISLTLFYMYIWGDMYIWVHIHVYRGHISSMAIFTLYEEVWLLWQRP